MEVEEIEQAPKSTEDVIPAGNVTKMSRKIGDIPHNLIFFRINQQKSTKKARKARKNVGNQTGYSSTT